MRKVITSQYFAGVRTAVPIILGFVPVGIAYAILARQAGFSVVETILMSMMVFAMACVAYLPRAIPAVLINKMRFGPKFEKFLPLIPYTAMSALIFPGVLFVDTERYEIGIIGGLVAGALAWKKLPAMVYVLAAVVTDMILYLIF